MLTIYSVASFLRKNMLQILSCIILSLFLITTWLFFQKKHTFPESTHIAIQEEFQNMIKERLLQQNPLVENIQFRELWTETTDQSKQIKTVFSYTFINPTDQEPVKVTVRGFALIDQEKVSEEKKEFWKVGAFNVDQTEITFDNEMIIISPEDQKKSIKKNHHDNKKTQDSS